MIETYVKIYLKRNILLAFVCSVIGFIPLFIVSLVYDVISYDLIISFCPFLIAFLCFSISLFPIIRFKKMIASQELLYGIVFSDNNSTRLETTLYLSDEWLIWACYCAIHKKHIQSVKCKRGHSRVGSSYRVKITTIDKKHYIIWCLNFSSIKKINSWRKT